MLNTKMKTSLEAKFGKKLKTTKYTPSDDSYIGDDVTVTLPRANKSSGTEGEKSALLQEGIPVGYRARHGPKDEFSKKSVYYEYPIEDDLERDFSKLLLKKNSRINICCYMVSTNGLKPYLKYLLYKYPESEEAYSDLLVFPFFLHDGESDIRERCIDEITEYLDNIGGSSSVYVRGYKEGESGVNVFIELDGKVYDSLNEIKHQTRGSELWFVLIKEIIDVRNVVNFPIHSSVTDFFLNNMSFLFLLDKDQRPYTLPLVAYHGNYYKVISFVAVFGLKKSSVFSSLGPYYYFGTYEKALRYAVWTHSHKPMTVDGETITINDTGKYKKGGIVRFAIFPGNMKVFLNRPDDPEDVSRLTQEKKADDEWISQTARLRDVDGKWAEKYNSVYQGVMILADGRKNQRGPHWVLRDYEQQTPLTYHYVDTSKFDDGLVKEPTYYKDNVYYVD